MKSGRILQSIIPFCLKYKVQILFLILLILHIFLRGYNLFQKASLQWDQVDSAWAAKSIIVDKHFLINGPVAKGNSGIYMGPLYFYAISIFYFFTNLDPIASPLFQFSLSIINLAVLFFVTKKLFGTKTAFVAGILNTFSSTVMNSDRTQSAYYLIVTISYLIFFALYKVLSGKIKYIRLLAIFTALSFHVDFTSIFYPILILFALPFFPRNRKTLKEILISIPLFLVFFIPSILMYLINNRSVSNSFTNLFQNSYHGLHLVRILQISHDAFISFEQILEIGFLRSFVFFIPVIFAAVYYFKSPKKQSLLLIYLIGLWTFIPWIILSTYSGELTNYYFSLPMDLVIAILSYLLLFLFQQKNILYKIIPIIFLVFYIKNGIQLFVSAPGGNLLPDEESVRQSIANKQIILYKDHDPISYIYYVYTKNTASNRNAPKK